jgi:uncharacterized alkaline shock family protein YloU
VEGQATISDDIFERYAADAATDVDGVRGLVESRLRRHRGVRAVRSEQTGSTIELHLELAWGVPIRETGLAVQRRVADYLEQMTGARPTAVTIVVDAVGPPE